MEYYTAPDEHPRQAEMDRLADQIDDLYAKVYALESLPRDYTAEEEKLYVQLEKQILELENSINAIEEGE